MELANRLRKLAARIPQQLQHISTEEATKNALVLPFLGALGYDVFNPTEVTPELTADVGVKKGEKVDYAVLLEGEPIMLFEVKACSCSLDQAHMSQLYRYFSVTAARLGVLTNGIQYRFFTDLDAANKMDDRPFLEVDLLSLDEHQLAQLRKFAKSQFQLESILGSATDLKYTGEMKKILGREVEKPSEELVRFFTAQVYSGRLTQAVREQFTEITRKALQEFHPGSRPRAAGVGAGGRGRACFGRGGAAGGGRGGRRAGRRGHHRGGVGGLLHRPSHPERGRRPEAGGDAGREVLLRHPARRQQTASRSAACTSTLARSTSACSTRRRRRAGCRSARSRSSTRWRTGSARRSDATSRLADRRPSPFARRCRRARPGLAV